MPQNMDAIVIKFFTHDVFLQKSFRDGAKIQS